VRTSLACGQATALTRSITTAATPQLLHLALTEGGNRADTLLFERSGGPTLLMDRAAVRVECRGQRVVLTALSRNGSLAIEAVSRRLADRILSIEPGKATFEFPKASSDDLADRLTAPSPLDALRELLAFEVQSSHEPFTMTLVGVSAFDQAALFEDIPDGQDDPLDFPDYLYWLAESLVIFERNAPPRLVCLALGSENPGHASRSFFDAAERISSLAERCAQPSGKPLPSTNSPGTPRPNVDLDDRQFAAVVERLKGEIAAGEVYQIVPSRTFTAPYPDPLDAFRRQTEIDPSPYQFFISAPAHTLFGASPETSVRIFQDGDRRTVEVKPIAGTRPRGTSPDDDDRMEAELRLNEKELAEHMMLVDLARNDVARISEPGTRRVSRLMSVERYARVMHLVTSVIGKLRAGLDAFHALQACLNVGTLSGAPKIRATQLLREVEQTRRGPYGGAVGWMNGIGEMDTGVVIRSASVKDGIAYIRAGAGVLHDSDPVAEADETRRKASALLSALCPSEEPA
jgi:anthranilate synthase component I